MHKKTLRIFKQTFIIYSYHFPPFDFLRSLALAKYSCSLSLMPSFPFPFLSEEDFLVSDFLRLSFLDLLLRLFPSSLLELSESDDESELDELEDESELDDDDELLELSEPEEED